MNAKLINVCKIGLVVVLAIVFMVVLANSVMTIQRSSPPPPPPRHSAAVVGQAATPAPAPAAVTAVEVPRVSEKTESGRPAWPVFELAEIIDYDPFAIAKAEGVGTPGAAAPIAGAGNEAGSRATTGATASAKESETGFKGRIHAVYQRGGTTAALVGSKTVRAGDQLEGGGRIVEVDQGGVMLEVNKNK